MTHGRSAFIGYHSASQSDPYGGIDDVGLTLSLFKPLRGFDEANVHASGYCSAELSRNDLFFGPRLRMQVGQTIGPEGRYRCWNDGMEPESARS